MNGSQSNKLKMFENVKDFLNKHSTETNSISAISVVQVKLHSLINQINEQTMIASTDTRSFTVLKSEKRAALNHAILKVSKAYSAWCYFNEQFNEAKKFDISSAALDAISSNEIYTFAQLVAATAGKKTDLLIPFNTTGADFTRLNNLANEFLLLKDAPLHERSNKKTAYTLVRKLILETDHLIRFKLDHLMDIFQPSNLTLYQQYKIVRRTNTAERSVVSDISGVALQASISVVSELPYLANRSYRFKNNGSVPLTVSLSNSENMLQGVTATVVPGKKIIRRSDTMNQDASAAFLLIQNPDNEMAGSYEISVAE